MFMIHIANLKIESHSFWSLLWHVHAWEYTDALGQLSFIFTFILVIITRLQVENHMSILRYIF